VLLTNISINPNILKLKIDNERACGYGFFLTGSKNVNTFQNHMDAAGKNGLAYNV
jgi:hypothetical protein